MKKKITAKGKRRDCQVLAGWARSISNHVYFCAASSNGDAELAREKWVSVVRHVANIHTGHGKLYPQCTHEELDDRQWIALGNDNDIDNSSYLRAHLYVICHPGLLADIKMNQCSEIQFV